MWKAAIWLCWAVLAVFGTLRSVAADAEVYRVRPGDKLRIVVLRQPEYTQEVLVQSDGKIVYFFVGELEVAGLTPLEVGRKIREGLRRQFEEPEVIVSPILEGNEVYVGGQVTLPNRYTFKQDTIDLRRAVILAGDVAPIRGDRSRVLLFHDGSAPTTHDLTDADAPNVNVHPGDVVFVPEKIAVRVTGNVQKPDIYYVSQAVSVGHALGLAGGSLDDKGMLSQLVIYRRGGETETVSLSEAYMESVDKQPLLNHGDTLYVPNAYRIEEISVLGYVHQPGMFRVRGSIPIGRALALAGGPITDTANLHKTTVLRLDGTLEVVDYTRRATDYLIYPGETVQVGKRFQVNWPLIFSFVSAAALVYRLLQP